MVCKGSLCELRYCIIHLLIYLAKHQFENKMHVVLLIHSSCMCFQPPSKCVIFGVECFFFRRIWEGNTLLVWSAEHCFDGVFSIKKLNTCSHYNCFFDSVEYEFRHRNWPVFSNKAHILLNKLILKNFSCNKKFRTKCSIVLSYKKCLITWNILNIVSWAGINGRRKELSNQYLVELHRESY